MGDFDAVLRIGPFQLAVGPPGMIFLKSRYRSVWKFYFFHIKGATGVEFRIRGK